MTTVTTLGDGSVDYACSVCNHTFNYAKAGTVLVTQATAHHLLQVHSGLIITQKA